MDDSKVRWYRRITASQMLQAAAFAVAVIQEKFAFLCRFSLFLFDKQLSLTVGEDYGTKSN